MARVLKGSHSFTCTPRVHPLTEWTIPAFAFPAEAGTHLPTPEGWKAELAWVVTLQSAMNAGARLVCSAWKLKHIAPLFRDLHWLRLPQRIEFKLAALVFRCLHGTAPQYLESELGALWQTLTRDADYVLHLRHCSARRSTDSLRYRQRLRLRRCWPLACGTACGHSISYCRVC